METIKEKLIRIRKFGMGSVETVEPDHEKQILMAQINHLEKKVKVMESALDYIASDVASAEELTEVAQRALEATSMRDWRKDEPNRN